MDFIIDNNQYTLLGSTGHPPMVDIKGEICFRITMENAFLAYLLDEKYIDLTSMMMYSEAIEQLKNMANLLMNTCKFGASTKKEELCLRKRLLT